MRSRGENNELRKESRNMKPIDLSSPIVVEMTNAFFSPGRPSWREAHEFEGTPSECVDEYQDFRELSGSCFTACRVNNDYDSEDPIIEWSDVIDAFDSNRIRNL
jgi:hypothetical protein